LRLAHRRSLDIDLFRDTGFDAEDLLRELETDGLVVSNVRTKPNTLWFELAGVPVSLMRFPYPCVAPGISSPTPKSSMAQFVKYEPAIGIIGGPLGM
jgi:hypothetical protein